jgi:hypothetical protein
MRTTLLFIIIVISCSQIFSQRLDGVFLISANPKWEYVQYDSSQVQLRSADAEGTVIAFQDTSFCMFRGYLTGHEGRNVTGFSIGDGGTIYKGQYSKIEKGYLLVYHKNYSWPITSTSINKSHVDTLSTEFVPNGGLCPFPIRKFRGEYLVELDKGYWLFDKELFSELKKYLFEYKQ